LETTKSNSIRLPSGLELQYPGLDGEYDQINERYSDFKYYTGEEKTPHKIYGGYLTENVVQALARTIVAYQMLEIAKRYRVVMMVHDEVVCVVPEPEVAEAEQFMLTEMRKPPAWAPDLPLNAEVESGQRYA
jgi:DNA polymerase